MKVFKGVLLLFLFPLVSFSQSIEIGDEVEMSPNSSYSYQLDGGISVVVQPRYEEETGRKSILLFYVDDGHIVASFRMESHEIVSNYELEYRTEENEIVDEPKNLATRIVEGKLQSQIFRYRKENQRIAFFDINGDFFPNRKTVYPVGLDERIRSFGISYDYEEIPAESDSD